MVFLSEPAAWVLRTVKSAMSMFSWGTALTSLAGRAEAVAARRVKMAVAACILAVGGLFLLRKKRRSVVGGEELLVIVVV